MDGYFQIEKKGEKRKWGGEEEIKERGRDVEGGMGEGQVDEKGGDKRMWGGRRLETKE